MSKNKHPVSIFLRTLLISTLVISLVGAGLFAGYSYARSKSAPGLGGVSFGGGFKLFDPTPERVNFLIMGVDSGGTRADSIIAGSFMPKDGRLALVSVPRDTMVTMPENRLAVVKGYNSLAPSDGVMKLNEVLHHAGSEHGVVYTKLQVEELLGISLDYYVKINLEGLVYFVDAIGGVEFDVPRRMYYNDPTQNLLIDLQPGLQRLDGKSAEGLLRFRKGYADSDFSRMQNQQLFLKALAEQALASENIMRSLPAVISAGLKYVETNFGAADIPKYLKYITNLSPEKITVATLPSSRKVVRGKDFQELDMEAARGIIETAFHGAAGGDAAESSIGKSIRVLNGGNTAGLAAQKRDMLAGKGYTVDSVGDYDGEKLPETRVFVKRQGMGEDLKPFFTACDIEVDPEMTGGYDIVVVLGTLEKLEG